LSRPRSRACIAATRWTLSKIFFEVGANPAR
jgi:hypothetical protein